MFLIHIKHRNQIDQNSQKNVSAIYIVLIEHNIYKYIYI